MDPEIEAVEDGDDVEDVQQDDPSQTDDDAPSGDDQVDASGETPGDDDDEVTVSIGDEDPATDPGQEAPPWVRTLRKDHQRVLRENRELKQENDKLKAPAAPAAIVVGDKPTLQGCGYDEAKFESDLEAWHERKHKADNQQRDHEEAQRLANEAWNTRLAAYAKAKSTLKVKDFDEAEGAVLAAFDVTQQGILLHTKQPEILVYALGKNAAAREDLAKVKTPLDFAIAVGALMTKLKVTPRKLPPPPERRVNGGAPGRAGTAGSDAQLAKLEAEADRTGDRTKVAAYRRKLSQQAAA